MNKATHVSRVLLFVACCAALGAPALASAEPRGRPNIVILLADDLGYGDVAVFGHPSIRTPALDRMAAQGQRWTNFYTVAPVCSPSRGALMTGRLPVRTGLYGRELGVFFRDDPNGIPAAEVTLAEALQGAGYNTAIFGKWHLGDTRAAFPTRHGFDEWLGLPYSNDMDWTSGLTLLEFRAANVAGDHKLVSEEYATKFAQIFSPEIQYWNVPLIKSVATHGVHRDEVVERPADQRQLTRRYTEEAVRYIQRHDAATAPFFMYVAYTMPHVPLFRSRDFVNSSEAGLYGDVVEELDWSVGQIQEAVKQRGLAENTLVVFTSDNGPWLRMQQHGGSAGALRQGKDTTFEGGMRVPAIFWWPGAIAPAVVDDIGTIMDLYATALALADVAAPAISAIDAIDLTPTLLAGKRNVRTTMPYYRRHELRAFRKGPYKVHFMTQGADGAPPAYTRHQPPLLYHLGEDPGEKFDLAVQCPDVLRELIAAAAAHRERRRSNIGCAGAMLRDASVRAGLESAANPHS